MPSPRELKVHTESIMKGALFKKKMEEEREFLKRQEWHLQQQQHKASGLGDGNRSLSMDLHQSPGTKPNIGRNAFPGKFSFLPTSVMREKVSENIIGTLGAAVDNLNNQPNQSWLESNDSPKPPDTHKGKFAKI